MRGTRRTSCSKRTPRRTRRTKSPVCPPHPPPPPPLCHSLFLPVLFLLLILFHSLSLSPSSLSLSPFLLLFSFSFVFSTPLLRLLLLHAVIHHFPPFLSCFNSLRFLLTQLSLSFRRRISSSLCPIFALPVSRPLHSTTLRCSLFVISFYDCFLTLNFPFRDLFKHSDGHIPLTSSALFSLSLLFLPPAWSIMLSSFSLLLDDDDVFAFSCHVLPVIFT